MNNALVLQNILLELLSLLDVLQFDHDEVMKFLSAMGVEEISECVKIDPITEDYRPCPQLQVCVPFERDKTLVLLLQNSIKK